MSPLLCLDSPTLSFTGKESKQLALNLCRETQDNFLKRFYLFTFIERGREGEKHQCGCASHMPATGDLACNPGVCPDWESNRQPFGLQARAESPELHQPGQVWVCFLSYFIILLLLVTKGSNFRTGIMTPSNMHSFQSKSMSCSVVDSSDFEKSLRKCYFNG